MPVISFFNASQYGTISNEQLIALLVWLFEIPPSKIFITGRKITVSATEETLRIMARCVRERNLYHYRNVRFSYSPIKLGRFQERYPQPYVVDKTGYKMLGVMSGNHPPIGEWNETTNCWDFREGLGYRNTGLTVPITSNGIKFQQPQDKRGLGFKGLYSKRNSTSNPIRFVSASTQTVSQMDGPPVLIDAETIKAMDLPKVRLIRSTADTVVPNRWDDKYEMSDEILQCLWNRKNPSTLPFPISPIYTENVETIEDTGA
jgi:hypothetical protein